MEINNKVIEMLNNSILDTVKVDEYYKQIKKCTENLKLMNTYRFNVRDILKPYKTFDGDIDYICKDIASLILSVPDLCSFDVIITFPPKHSTV